MAKSRWTMWVNRVLWMEVAVSVFLAAAHAGVGNGTLALILAVSALFAAWAAMLPPNHVRIS